MTCFQKVLLGVAVAVLAMQVFMATYDLGRAAGISAVMHQLQEQQ